MSFSTCFCHALCFYLHVCIIFVEMVFCVSKTGVATMNRCAVSVCWDSASFYVHCLHLNNMDDHMYLTMQHSSISAQFGWQKILQVFFHCSAGDLSCPWHVPHTVSFGVVALLFWSIIAAWVDFCIFSNGGGWMICHFSIIRVHFIFLLIEFHCTFFISCKIIPYYVY